jgi:hypothetical protein
MKREGLQIGLRLNHMDNLVIRRGIFKSLESMKFDCLANRNYYLQHFERLSKFTEAH